MDIATAPAERIEPLSSETQPNKRRRKKSIVWEHFTVETVGPDCTRACCKQCKKSFAYITGTKLAGTSHLKRHIALGICPVSRQKSQQSPFTPGSKTGGFGSATDQPKKRYRVTSGFGIDQDRCNHELAKMIIMHNYPLNIVEHPGFISFLRTLQPQFNELSFNSIQGDCVGIYLKEKHNLLNFLSGIPGRICLTLDLWTSDQTLGYVVLTGHFVDGDWMLHRRILNVVMVPYPNSDDAFSQAVVACLSDWGLENRLFTITLDQSVLNETQIGYLRGLLSIKNPLMLNGQLLVGNCYAHVLSRLAQGALSALSETVGKVRESVKYVKTSEAREEKFMELKQQLQVPSTKSLIIDNRTKWDTTYHMLEAASELKEVFACLDTSEPDYKQTPSMEEWKQVESLLKPLQLIFESANILTSPVYPTANVFFNNASKIQSDLTHWAMSEDPFTSYLTRPLQERFDKYWKDCCLVLAMAVAMDPRYKLRFVKYSFSKSFGGDAENWIRIVDDGLRELYLEYVTLSLSPPPTHMEEGNEGVIKTELSQEGGVTLVSNGDGLMDFEVYISENQGSKPELDQYLEESLVPRETPDFDILSWWKLNRATYPTLYKMATDVLSIPVSTVAPDSVFDTTSGKISSYQGLLRPVTLEALICAKDWLQYGSSAFEATVSSTALVKKEF